MLIPHQVKLAEDNETSIKSIKCCDQKKNLPLKTKALAKRDEQFNEQCLTFMFCKCSSRLATLFADKFHVEQCSTLFENFSMKIKKFLELFHVLQMFIAFGHSDDQYNEQMRFFNARKSI